MLSSGNCINANSSGIYQVLYGVVTLSISVNLHQLKKSNYQNTNKWAQKYTNTIKRLCSNTGKLNKGKHDTSEHNQVTSQRHHGAEKGKKYQSCIFCNDSFYQFILMIIVEGKISLLWQNDLLYMI